MQSAPGLISFLVVELNWDILQRILHNHSHTDRDIAGAQLTHQRGQVGQGEGGEERAHPEVQPELEVDQIPMKLGRWPILHRSCPGPGFPGRPLFVAQDNCLGLHGLEWVEVGDGNVADANAVEDGTEAGDGGDGADVVVDEVFVVDGDSMAKK